MASHVIFGEREVGNKLIKTIHCLFIGISANSAQRTRPKQPLGNTLFAEFFGETVVIPPDAENLEPYGSRTTQCVGLNCLNRGELLTGNRCISEAYPCNINSVLLRRMRSCSIGEPWI